MHYSPILAPVVALVAWTLVMHVVDGRSPRCSAFAQGSASRSATCPRGGRGVDLDGARRPDEAQWKSHNYNHLMEQPTIFYAIALSARADGLRRRRSIVWLAWGYVGFRIVHSIVQATVNIVAIRFPMFALAIALPARPDRPRRLLHPPRLRRSSAEAGRKLDMGRPAELADRPDPVERVAAVDQQSWHRARRSRDCS